MDNWMTLPNRENFCDNSDCPYRDCCEGLKNFCEYEYNWKELNEDIKREETDD